MGYLLVTETRETDTQNEKGRQPARGGSASLPESVGTSLWRPLSDGHNGTVSAHSNIAGYKVQGRVWRPHPEERSHSASKTRVNALKGSRLEEPAPGLIRGRGRLHQAKSLLGHPSRHPLRVLLRMRPVFVATRAVTTRPPPPRPARPG